MTALTTAERQSTRRRRLNEAAQAMGYASWGKFETAVLRGDADIPPNNENPPRILYVKADTTGYTSTSRP